MKFLPILISFLLFANNTNLALPKDNQSVNISFAGDCTLGEFKGQGSGNQFKDYKSNGWNYYFENVQSVFANDDLTFINLEGPLTDYPQTAVKTYPIKGDKENINILKNSSIEVVNLSNNHIYDCGKIGFEDCVKALSENNISFCGEGYKATKTVSGITITFLGYNGWSTDIKEKVIKDLAEDTSDIKIVEFHWGIEREYTHNKTQEIIAHAAVDAGADIVVGAHPHVLQDMEYYKNVPIFYSLGNFCFGANKNPKDKDSVIVNATFTKNGIKDMKVIPCKISSTDSKNDYKPTIVTDEGSILRIMKKLKMQ